MEIKKKKTAIINLRISPSDKSRLKEKAQQVNMNLTEFLEKIANEPIIFISKDIRVILEAVKNV